MCRYRTRNKGLWISSQQLQGDSARFTRQNPNGDRHGYECPEERDYFPYWGPTEWRDVVILTNDLGRCAAWQAESQNVKSRWYCSVTQQWIDQQLQGNEDREAFIPITQAGCDRIQGTWKEVPAFGIPAPLCIQAPWTRDNHLGNRAGAGYPADFNWTIPAWLKEESCVLRLRYNISTAETREGGDWLSDTSIQDGPLNSTLNYIRKTPPQGLTVEDEDDPYSFKYATQMDVWTKYRLQKSDMTANFDPVLYYQGQPTRGYVFSNDPLIDIFGTLIPNGKILKLRLAFDTSQFARTFQDRSHTFAIRQRPDPLKDITIHNLGVRGKRGNIVQTYPSTEYDFVPQSLVIERGDFIHFQWIGSNTNPNNNAGQGTQGTDRSNVILLRNKPPEYQVNAMLQGPFPGHTGAYKQSYPARLDDTADTANFCGFSYRIKMALARPGVYTQFVDVGPVQVRREGTYNYVSTRNNNFSNRDQKAQIQVIPRSPTNPSGPYAELDTEAIFSRLVTQSGNAWLRFAPDPIGVTSGSQITISELPDGRILVTPPLFDVIKPQMVFLECKYTQTGLQTIAIIQSDYDDERFTNELPTSADGGIASAMITRGGYYHVDDRVSVGAVVGIVIGCTAVLGGAGLLYFQIKKKFNIRGGKKAHLMDTNTV